MMETHNIHVTGVGGCTRSFYLSLKNQGMKAHAFTARGTLTHRAIESALTGQKFEAYAHLSDDDKAVITKDMYDKLIPEVYELVKRAKDWLNASAINPSDFTVETEFHYHIKDGYILTGTPDAFTDKTIYDFKTGQRYLRAHLMQLAAYSHMLHKKDGLKRDAVLVYLGGDKVSEKYISKDELDKAYAEFEETLDKEIEARKAIFTLGSKGDCEVTFKCVFCPYRGICDGV